MLLGASGSTPFLGAARSTALGRLLGASRTSSSGLLVWASGASSSGFLLLLLLRLLLLLLQHFLACQGTTVLGGHLRGLGDASDHHLFPQIHDLGLAFR